MEALLAAGAALLVVYFAVIILMIVGIWKVYSKAGQPGVAAIVPIWSNYVMTCGVAKKEILWFILQFIPFVNIVIIILVIVEVGKKFGKSGGFIAGMIFLPFIFWPILGFGSSQYEYSRKKSRRDYRDDYEDEEEDDRPRRRPTRDEDEDERPRRKGRRDDD